MKQVLGLEAFFTCVFYSFLKKSVFGGRRIKHYVCVIYLGFLIVDGSHNHSKKGNIYGIEQISS